MGLIVKRIGTSIVLTYKDAPIFDKAKAAAAIFAVAKRHFDLALQDIAGHVSDESPVGVTGNLAQSWGANPATATGGIELLGNSIENLEGRVFSSLPYAIVIDQGREPGARMPPVDALILWAERVLQVSGTPDELESVGWALAKSIQKKGIKARGFVDKGVTRALPRVEGVLQIMADAIAIALTEDNQGV